jgi:tetratricopeptide (TPR) repeat protein
VTAILSGLVLLVFLTALVIWLLPAVITRENPPRQAPDSGRAVSPPESEEQNPHRPEAERLLGEWLQREARAGTENLAAWGGSEYITILDAADRADRMLRRGNFQAALSGYRQAVTGFDALLATREEKLAAALARGRTALDNNDSEAAVIAFAEARAIAPDSEEAGQAMEQARARDASLALYREGLELEKNGDLEGALRSFREAARTDAGFADAARALERVEKDLADIRFRVAMSDALAALEKENLQVSAAAVARALELRPGDPAARAAELRVRRKKTAAALLDLRRQAESLAAAEKWQEALASYQAALQIDSLAGFAVTGKREAEARHQLDRAVRNILASPGRLQDRTVLREAEQVLSRAREVEGSGPVLQSQIENLEKLVAEAATPVEVNLRSDNATMVEIYHVGVFAPFYEKRLQLRPGSYTFVGRRPGYRDVRLTVEVKPGDAPPLFVFIRCEEPL